MDFDDELEEIEEYLIEQVIAYAIGIIGRRFDKQPCNDSMLSGGAYMNEVLEGHNDRCRRMFRFEPLDNVRDNPKLEAGHVTYSLELEDTNPLWKALELINLMKITLEKGRKRCHTSTVGLKTKEGVVLAVEKRITSPLLVELEKSCPGTQLKERKNRAKKIRGVTTKAGDDAKAGKKKLSG
ncbi:hypothetical protein IFM89_021928 [Coptis chinensis]|uniref:Uncharacterized protein n=1 Tax=Coptis chinensis TaxID=261450 RepID=A0A835HGQ5_9MAGN|nr:hypothetical protein IFM89_021928 [Coptis chinensis]